jgi:hypothetical protein
MSIDRLERSLPQVLTELSLPVVPDYVDTLLSRTERIAQKPGWLFPERWFPVSTITDAFTAPRRFPLRPLVILAVVLALIATSIAFYVGTQQAKPAPPIGLAKNGIVVTRSATGDLIAVDPVSESQRTILAGPNLCCGQVSPDGLRVAVLDLPNPQADPTRLRIVDMQGSLIRDLVGSDLRQLNDFSFSPDGTRLLLSYQTQPRILDIASGTFTTLDAPGQEIFASWIGATGDILLTNRRSEDLTSVSRLAAGTTTGATQVTELQFVVDRPHVSPDGSKFLYFIWGTAAGTQGRLHVFDFATGKDIEISPPQKTGTADETQWENPIWSPDGKYIAAEVYTAGPNHVQIVPSAGGPAVVAGPAFPTGSGGTVMQFSPDGTQLLIVYRFDNSTWLVPVTGGDGRKVSWNFAEDASWQRQAP